ncbi:MAG: SpoVR family protein [Acidobacteriota bacterium]|nr:MAG: SpoVR family protein [Acidobacteriota bacterium]
MPLPRELAELQMEVEAVAQRYGLSTFPVVFEMVDYAQMNQLAAYTGFPVRYPHWRWGMEYDQLAKSYEYGLHKIYEMVINNDPTYAYLLEGNTLLDQKLVMAHVYGHADFFRNNIFFSHTNRKMVDQMANHATRMRRYQDRLGIERVESFLDACLAIENLIDPQAAFEDHYGLSDAHEEQLDPNEPIAVRSLPAKDYMDRYVNPPEFLERQRATLQQEREKRRRFPRSPRRDVLGFLLRHAPLDSWERDILGIVREESYYFLPQRQSKIMNEGWASFWHTRMLTRDLLHDSELVDYADHHSGTTAVQPGRLNPYKLGLELFRDIECRWDTGRFGPEWDACDDMAERTHWDRQTGLGRDKAFEVRRVHCDLTFLDEFLTVDFCRRQKLFVFGRERRKNAWVITSREFDEIKQALLFQLTNAGTPIIEVVDGNFRNRGELLLAHRHDGVDLRKDWAIETLGALALVWRRPVFVETTVRGKPQRLGHDGQQPCEEDI